MAETRIVFYVGADMREHPIAGSLDARADEILAETFGGSTRQDSRGSWKGPNGLEFEDSIRFEVSTDRADTLEIAGKVAEDLRKLYRQSEVLYSLDAIILRRTNQGMGPQLVRSPEGYLTLAPKQPIGSAERAILSDELDGGPQE